MKTATYDMNPLHTAVPAGVVVGFASRGFVVLAGTVPAPIRRH